MQPPAGSYYSLTDLLSRLDRGTPRWAIQTELTAIGLGVGGLPFGVKDCFRFWIGFGRFWSGCWRVRLFGCDWGKGFGCINPSANNPAGYDPDAAPPPPNDARQALLYPNLLLLFYPISRGSALLQALGISYPAAGAAPARPAGTWGWPQVPAPVARRAGCLSFGSGTGANAPRPSAPQKP